MGKEGSHIFWCQASGSRTSSKPSTSLGPSLLTSRAQSFPLFPGPYSEAPGGRHPAVRTRSFAGRCGSGSESSTRSSYWSSDPAASIGNQMRRSPALTEEEEDRDHAAAPVGSLRTTPEEAFPPRARGSCCSQPRSGPRTAPGAPVPKNLASV